MFFKYILIIWGFRLDKLVQFVITTHINIYIFEEHIEMLKKKYLNWGQSFNFISRKDYNNMKCLCLMYMINRGCESGYQCLLLVNGQKRECPVNSNAVCQCIRRKYPWIDRLIDRLSSCVLRRVGNIPAI